MHTDKLATKVRNQKKNVSQSSVVGTITASEGRESMKCQSLKGSYQVDET